MYTVYSISRQDHVLYIGSTKNLKARWLTHCTPSESNKPLGQLITKHGKNAFVIDVIQDDIPTKKTASEIEASAVALWHPECNRTFTGQPGCYGENNPMRRPEMRAKFIGENNPAKHPEARAKISAANRKNNPTKRPGARAKISAARRLPQQKVNHIRYLYTNGLHKLDIASICQISRVTVDKYTKDLRSTKPQSE